MTFTHRWAAFAGLVLATGAVNAADKPAAPEAAAPAAAPALAERVIEKREGEYAFRLLVKPGNLEPGRVADVSVEILRVLEIPDPQYGDRMPVKAEGPVASVKPPEPPFDPRNRKPAPAPEPVEYVLHPLATAGNFAFHFTPAADGVFELSVTGRDTRREADEQSFKSTFRIGVGTAVAQTEQSQGGAPRRGARRPVGMGGARAQEEKIQKLMTEVGERYLDLGALLASAPAKGPNAAAAAEARALAALFAQAKGLAPAAYASAGGEFDKLAANAQAALEALATKAEDAKDKTAPKATLEQFEQLELQNCNQCHAKFRWGVTTELASWPSFQQKPWKK